MILRRFFPATSSGPSNNSMKRWWRFQQTINKKRWFEMDRELNGPITLWDFATIEDAQDAAMVDETSKRGGWRISDDSVIGGYSRATLELIQTPQDYQRVLRGERSLSMEDPTRIREILASRTEDGTLVPPAFTPFVRWKGAIDTRVNQDTNANMENAGKNVVRSGFCAIRSPEFPYGGADLGGRYNGLEFTCRSDGRPYSINLKCESFIENDMFQCFIAIPPTAEPEPNDPSGGPFDHVVLLFHHFSVTSGGRMRSTQRVLDDSIKIQSIGFTLMDGVDGDFQFDLARIRAINYDENGVIGQVD
jgi:hypothetical protein